MNFPTGLLYAAYKYVSHHKDDIIDFAKDAADTAVETAKDVVEAITESI